MRRLVLLLLVEALVVAGGWAETPASHGDAASGGTAVRVQRLDDGWRVREGDDAAWARADLDDSGWRVTSLAAEAQNLTPGWRWFRRRVRLGAGEDALALVGPVHEFELYVNGRHLPGTDLRGRWHTYANREMVLRLPSCGDRAAATRDGGCEAVLAVLVHYRPMDAQTYGVSLDSVSAGPLPEMERVAAVEREHRQLGLAASAAADALQIVVGVVLLVLFALELRTRSFLWLGLILIQSGISGYTFYAVQAGRIPAGWNDFIGDPSGYVGAILAIEFVFSYLGTRVPRAWRAWEWAVLTGVVASAMASFGVLTAAQYLSIEAMLSLPVAVVLPIALVRRYVRGERDAGWLAAAMLVSYAGTILGDIGLVAAMVPVPQLVWANTLALPMPYALRPLDLANLGFLVVILILMVLRISRASREQARTAAELGAAREVQQRLVPAELPRVSGFRLGAAYRPAQEVGGDFYQVLPQADGGLLVVVGDVSGKGLKAAMTGTLAIGALRLLVAEGCAPGDLLKRLNEQLVGATDGGFVTCVCVRLAADGRGVVANAGHLSPYAGGREIAVESGLPLGLVRGVEYEETAVALAPGEQLTLLSDGVVEAQDAAGELFGFARTAALSMDAADAIAHAAEAHGQSDDITVVTVALGQS